MKHLIKLTGILAITAMIFWGCEKEEEETGDSACDGRWEFTYDDIDYDMCRVFQYSLVNNHDLIVDVTNGTAKQLYGSGGDDYGYRMRIEFNPFDGENLTISQYKVGNPTLSPSEVIEGTATIELTLLESNKVIVPDSGTIVLREFVEDESILFSTGDLYADGKQIIGLYYNAEFSEVKFSDLE